VPGAGTQHAHCANVVGAAGRRPVGAGGWPDPPLPGVLDPSARALAACRPPHYVTEALNRESIGRFIVPAGICDELGPHSAPVAQRPPDVEDPNAILVIDGGPADA
jgi:hypothetical protein